MNRFCGNCFNETLNEQGICTLCGFDAQANRQIAPHALPAGTILNGRYIIGRVLGQGGFGITYTAKDHQTGQVVAVKEFFPDSMAMRSSMTEVTPFQGERGENFAYGRETFLQEAQTMAEFIGNPNIVRVYSYFEENGTAYFAMEYVDGESYLAYLKARGGKIPVAEALKILYPVMDALSAVHEKNIIHRDVTPDNIYISKNGTVKLLDFGAARYSLGNASRSLDVILKHGFAPREQYKRRGRQGPYTDVYSLGATLYYSITGIRPDDALERVDEDTVVLPGTMGVKISREQETVMMKAMAVDPEDRYQTMAEFRQALSAAKSMPKQQEHHTSPMQKTTSAEKTVYKAPKKLKKPGKKSKWMIPSAIVIILCIAVAFALRGGEEPALSTQPTVITAATQEATPDKVPVPLTAEEEAYNAAVDLFYREEYGKAAIAFAKLGDFRDAKEVSRQIWDAIADRDTISTGRTHTVGIRNDGTLVACGTNSYGESNVDNISDAVAVTVDGANTFVLHSDGTVTSTSWWYDYDLSQWNDIVAIKAHHTGLMGLKADGTIIVTNPVCYDCYGSVSTWLESVHDIVSIEPVGLIPLFVNSDGAIVSFDGGKRDGTKIDYSQTQNWKNVISVVGGSGAVYALTEDGTVSKAVINEAQHQNSWEENEVDVDGWSDIIKISGSAHLLGLKADGTVVATGRNLNKECQTENWTDIVAVSAGWLHSVGLKSDGTVVTAGTTKDGLGMASKWSDIKLPADRDALLAAIKLDYITDSGDDSPAQHDTEKKVPADISENILMGLGISEKESRRIGGGDNAVAPISKLPLFNTVAKRKDVRTITFLDTTKNAPTDAADASALGNGKVKAWAEQNGDLYDVYVAAEGGVLAPENCDLLFSCMPNLTSIDFGNAFDTAKVTTMGDMFGYCPNLKALDLSSFNTSNVNNMGGIFYECSGLESLNLASFDTSNVTNMSCMFYMCKGLKTLDVTGFDTSNVTNMQCMFLQCNSLRELDLSSFDVSNVKDTFNMFYKCPAERPKWYNYTMD